MTLFDQKASPYLRLDQTMIVGDILDAGQVPISSESPRERISLCGIGQYSFTFKIGSKLVGNLYMDMGQRFLECMQEISHDLEQS